MFERSPVGSPRLSNRLEVILQESWNHFLRGYFSGPSPFNLILKFKGDLGIVSFLRIAVKKRDLRTVCLREVA